MGILKLTPLLALAGCRFDPALEDGRVRCGVDGTCPPGFSCGRDERCRREAVSSASLDGGEPIVLDLTVEDDLAKKLNEESPDDLAIEFDLTPRCAPSECEIGSRCLPSGEWTGTGRVCSNGADLPCGFPGAHCCPQYVCGDKNCCVADRCVANEESCGNGTTCMDGACGACGSGGKICCAADHSLNLAPSWCTMGGTGCRAADNKCDPCGKKDDECCEGNRCNDGMCCDAAKKKCVGVGSSCNDGSLCFNGGCKSGNCGKLGQPACASGIGCTEAYTVPVGGACIACGQPDQPCCPATGGMWCAPPFACGFDGVCG